MDLEDLAVEHFLLCRLDFETLTGVHDLKNILVSSPAAKMTEEF